MARYFSWRTRMLVSKKSYVSAVTAVNRVAAFVACLALVCLGMTSVAVDAYAQGANARYYAATLSPGAAPPGVTVPYVLTVTNLSLIHISEPTRLGMIS